MVPEVAEELAAEEVDAFAEVDGGVLVEALEGALPLAREGRRRGRFL